MPTIYVKPSPGGRVRMPERNFIPMPAEGAWITRGDYYERLLIGGDVVICDPPAEPAAVLPVADLPAVQSDEPASVQPAAEPETPEASDDSAD